MEGEIITVRVGLVLLLGRLQYGLCRSGVHVGESMMEPAECGQLCITV